MDFIKEPEDLQKIFGGHCTGTFVCEDIYNCYGYDNCVCDHYNSC